MAFLAIHEDLQSSIPGFILAAIISSSIQTNCFSMANANILSGWDASCYREPSPLLHSTEYELYETRIQVRYLFFTINRQYSDFGCFYRDKHGIMLSTFKLPRRLDTFRGQSLRFSKSGEEIPLLIEILNQVGKDTDERDA
jgi:hypothetical protein